MEFALRCAYAHGTQALRTHLMSGRAQSQLSWRVSEEAGRVRACVLRLMRRHFVVRPAFAALRERWRGRVALQGVALVVLAFFRCVNIAGA